MAVTCRGCIYSFREGTPVESRLSIGREYVDECEQRPGLVSAYSGARRLRHRKLSLNLESTSRGKWVEVAKSSPICRMCTTGYIQMQINYSAMLGSLGIKVHVCTCTLPGDS